MQLTDIRSNVLISAGLDSTDTSASTTVLDALINQSLRELTNMRDWDWNKESEVITTVSGTSGYVRDADARVTTRLDHDDTGYSLKSITPNQGARYDHPGRPQFYFIEAGVIQLRPVPDRVWLINHHYLADEEILANGTDEPTMPDYAIDALILRAALKLSARLDNTSQYRLLADRERDAIEALKNDARRSKASPSIDARRDWGV